MFVIPQGLAIRQLQMDLMLLLLNINILDFEFCLSLCQPVRLSALPRFTLCSHSGTRYKISLFSIVVISLGCTPTDLLVRTSARVQCWKNPNSWPGTEIQTRGQGQRSKLVAKDRDPNSWPRTEIQTRGQGQRSRLVALSLIHISEPTRP